MNQLLVYWFNSIIFLVYLRKLPLIQKIFYDEYLLAAVSVFSWWVLPADHQMSSQPHVSVLKWSSSWLLILSFLYNKEYWLQFSYKIFGFDIWVMLPSQNKVGNTTIISSSSSFSSVFLGSLGRVGIFPLSCWWHSLVKHTWSAVSLWGGF